MNADNETYHGILESPFQYEVPPFQRYYTWTRDDWRKLWSDVFNLLERQDDDEPAQHFMGALVFVPVQQRLGSNPILQTIDGQQRLLTLSLLLCALRNVARSHSLGQLAEEIEKKYLIRQFEKGRDYLRIYPRQRDRKEYRAAVTGDRAPQAKFGKALRYFTKKIREDLQGLPGIKSGSTSEEACDLSISEEEDALQESSETERAGEVEARLRSLLAVLKGALTFVHITLDEQGAAYQTFQSLNSTGVDLSQADLIRSLVMRHVPAHQQDAFDDEEWRPMEERFYEVGELDEKALSRFFRHVLLTKGRYVYKADTTETFKKRYIADQRDFDPTQLTAKLRRLARLYDYLRGGVEHPSKPVAEAIEGLVRLETTTSFPLALALLDRLDAGKVTDQEVAEALLRVAGFVLRRKVCGQASTGFVRWFSFACKHLDHEDGALAGLTEFLVKKGYPTDEQFKEAFARFELFRSDYKRVTLEALEKSYPHRERADLSQAQAEHIMPQTPTDEWRADLGPRAEAIHDRLLHVPGNLSLSAYNGEIANRPFREKRHEYKRSNIVLNRHIADLDAWGEEEIEARSKALAKRASSIWVGPPF